MTVSSPSPPRKPIPEPTRAASPWLRTGILLGVFVIFLLPLSPLLIGNMRNPEAPQVLDVAEQFLATLRSDNPQALAPLMATPHPPVLAPHALPGALPLLARQVRCNLGRVQVAADRMSASVEYTLTPVAPGPGPARAPVAEAAFLQLSPERMLQAMAANEEERRQLLQAVSEELAGRLDGQKGELLLIRQGRAWKVHGIRCPPLIGGPPVNHIWAQQGEKATPQDRELQKLYEEYDQPRPRDADAWAASWHIDLDVRERPARDVLAQLEAGLDRPLIQSAFLRMPELDRPVTLRRTRGHRLEAIDEVYRQVDAINRFNLYRGVWQAPRAGATGYAGPVRLEVQRVEEFSPNPTGLLTLQCEALPGFDQPRCTIDQVRGPEGLDLYHRKNQYLYPSPMTTGSTSLIQRVPLRNLLRDLDALALVQGRAHVLLSLEVAELRFDHMTDGATARDGGLVVRLDRAADGGVENAWRLTGVDFQRYRVLYVARGPAGQRIGGGVCTTGTLTTPASTTALGVKILTRQEVTFPFELRDIPLDRPPRRLTPAAFPGQEAPVSISVRSAEGGKRQHILHNHSQKEVESLRVKRTFRDAAGRALAEQEDQVPSPATTTLAGRLPLLRSGNPVTLNSGEPEGTASVEVTVLYVGFSDGTTWERK